MRKIKTKRELVKEMLIWTGIYAVIMLGMVLTRDVHPEGWFGYPKVLILLTVAIVLHNACIFIKIKRLKFRGG